MKNSTRLLQNIFYPPISFYYIEVSDPINDTRVVVIQDN